MNLRHSFILFLFCLAPFIAPSIAYSEQTLVPHETVLSAKEYSLRYRYDQEKSETENDANRTQVLQEFKQTLPIYVVESELEPILRNFFSDSLKESSSDYAFVNAYSTGIGGNSADAVFLIKSNSGQLGYVIKVFEKPFELKGKFLREYCGLDFLADLKSSHLNVIQPLSLAILEFNQNTYGLLLETAAIGKRMDEFLFDLEKFEPGSEAREQGLDSAKKALTRMAEALAAFHSTKSDQPGSLIDDDLKDLEKRKKKILNNPNVVEEISKKIDIEQLFNYIEEKKIAAMQVPIFYTYLHGATHFGNVFYDSETNLITLIDVGALQRSFDKNGQPRACEFVDLLRPERDLFKKGISILSKEELELLCNAFHETYENFAGKPDEVLFEFFKASEALRNLGKYIKYQDEQDPELRKATETLFIHNLNYFEKKLLINN